MKKSISKKKKILIGIISVILAVMSIASFVAMAVIGNILDTQKEAERWRGESDMKFSQISCYLPADNKVQLQQIFEFRTAMMTKFHEAALDVDNENSLFVDAWSTDGKVNVSSSLGKGEVRVTAVGGNFFDFHPLRLLNGTYIYQQDLMKDRVLLDEDTAWLLFGGIDLEGMEMRINGVPFVVSGVIEREQDFASKKAYTAGMGIYMSYDAYKALNENAAISCYELCMAEPVKGFSVAFVKEKFPINGGDIIENTQRYSFGRLIKLLGQFGSRSMQTMGLSYPYWENAARCTEDWCLLLLFIGMFSAVMPVTVIIIVLVHYIKAGKNKLSDDVFPDIKEKTQEAIRVRQRKHWEKKNEKRKNK